MSHISFDNKNPVFFSALQKKVDNYFNTNTIKKTGDRPLYIKTVVLFSALIVNYYLLVFVQPPAWLSIILCALMGLNLAAIGFNVMHDGAHGSYSSKKWVNEAMSYSLNVMGGSAYLWKIKHNLNHHSYTNIEGMDDDIDIRPWIRTNKNQPLKWYHSFQHFYSFLLYGFTYVFWIYQADFTKYFTRKISGHKYRKMNTKEHIIFWVSKVVYVFLFLVWPALQLGWLKTLTGYAILTFVCGFILSIIFQLAHLITEAEFPVPDKESNKIEQEWALHQLATTGNFATRNRFISWLVGGLNFQVEHHLFPKISHIHYPALNAILKETCAQFNVKYIEYPTLASALRSHVKHLKITGNSR